MLYYEKIDVYEGDVNKSNKSRKCIIYNYYYFLKVNFQFQSSVCNNCHDLMQKAISFNHIVSVFVKRSYFRIRFW